MKKHIIITLSFLLCFVAAMAQPGTITNIRISQGTGTDLRLVDILFNLSGNDAAYDITLEVSFNDGSDYVAIDNANVTGNLIVAPGSDIHLVWDGRVNYSSQSADLSRIKITATTYTFACGGALFDSRDGQLYATVQISTQCWMAENLNIGTRIDGSGDQADNGTIEKYCYNNELDSCDVYGGLYQWNEMMQYVTTGVQGICPTGWHLPTDAEWMTLEEEVESTTGVNWNTMGWRGTDAGGNLKETGITHWNPPNTGATNNSGFTALPWGFRYSDGSFYNLGDYGYWWSSSEYSGTDAWIRGLGYDLGQVHRYNAGKAYGFSVRCLKD